MSTQSIDLSLPIYGLLDPEDVTATIVEGEPVTFKFFLGGGVPVRTTVAIDQVHLHELGAHLEAFSGIDESRPSKRTGVCPGERLSGVRNMAAGIVFLTQVGEEAVAQEIDFYNAQDDRER